MIAVVESAESRLRPILMTALTTIFGLLPMAMGDESASISYASMGKVVVGGLVAGTLLTLFYVPVLYTLLDDIQVVRPTILVSVPTLFNKIYDGIFNNVGQSSALSQKVFRFATGVARPQPKPNLLPAEEKPHQICGTFRKCKIL